MAWEKNMITKMELLTLDIYGSGWQIEFLSIDGKSVLFFGRFDGRFDFGFWS